MTDAQLAILRQKLSEDFVPHLPTLLDQTKLPAHMAAKNVCRAFPAFALQKICRLDAVTAAKAVVDDYEDNGLDAIYYHQASKKLFLVQSKLSADAPYDQDDANAFTKGARDLLNQQYGRFNKNVADRQAEIDLALDEAAEIILVLAHAGEIVSKHAQDVFTQFLTDAGKPDERLSDAFLDFGPVEAVDALLAEQAGAIVDDEIVIFGHQKIEAPRVTYYGQVTVTDLAALYAKHGNALLEKNIRYFLGINSSAVNRSIHGTLKGAPANFFYFNNGVTAIAHTIEPKGLREGGGRRFEVKGLSVINGAQTIASCHHFMTTQTGADISAARVLITLILVEQNDPFSSSVTRARNHQNPVSPADFAALDDTQDRLRRELAFDKIMYRYRSQARATTPGLDTMTIDEASIALALFNPDPGLVVTLKREPSRLLDTKGPDYSRLFNLELSGRKLANAVRLYRVASQVLGSNELAANGPEKLIYRHGRYAIMWLTFRAQFRWADRADVMTDAEAAALLSHPLDAWRERVRAMAVADLATVGKGPLAFFRTLTDARPFVCKLRDAGP